MIDTVTFEATTYNKVPYKFEAGTGNIAGAVGLGAAIDYLNRIGFEVANHYEEGLMAYATEAMAQLPGLREIGTAPQKAGVLSFLLDGAEPEEVGKFLDQEGIAVGQAPLRPTHNAAFRREGYSPCFTRLLQHLPGGGCTDRGPLQI